MNKLIAGFSLGANLPFGGFSPEDTLRAAIRRVQDLPGASGQAASPLYRTAAFPPGSGPDFVNGAVVAWFSLDEGDGPALAQRLLADCHRIEADFGRERLRRWGGRTLDIDLIFLSDFVLPDTRTQDDWRALPLDDQMSRAPETLILPHPRLQDRAFVLVPLAGLAPFWRHPLLGFTLQEMLDSLPQSQADEVKVI